MYSVWLQLMGQVKLAGSLYSVQLLVSLVKSAQCFSCCWVLLLPLLSRRLENSLEDRCEAMQIAAWVFIQPCPIPRSCAPKACWKTVYILWAHWAQGPRRASVQPGGLAAFQGSTAMCLLIGRPQVSNPKAWMLKLLRTHWGAISWRSNLVSLEESVAFPGHFVSTYC